MQPLPDLTMLANKLGTKAGLVETADVCHGTKDFFKVSGPGAVTGEQLAALGRSRGCYTLHEHQGPSPVGLDILQEHGIH